MKPLPLGTGEQTMNIKPNCKKCYYGGLWKPSESLASCSAPIPKEPTVTKFDEWLNRERRFVKRRNWDDECECRNFIPSLSEIDGDYELEKQLPPLTLLLIALFAARRLMFADLV